MEINPLEPVQTDMVRNINRIDPVDVKKFVVNESEMHALKNGTSRFHLSRAEFALIMKNRPLIKYRPLKNSFTKRGDMKILAGALEIKPSWIDGLIDRIIENDFEDNMEYSSIDGKWEKTNHIDENKLQMIRTYVYRHGKKEAMLKFFGNEIQNTKNLMQTLYRNFNSQLDGVSGYFSRPIHVLDSETVKILQNQIYARLDEAHAAGNITDEDRLEAAQYFLNWIGKIQGDSAVQRLYREMK